MRKGPISCPGILKFARRFDEVDCLEDHLRIGRLPLTERSFTVVQNVMENIASQSSTEFRQPRAHVF